MKNAVLERLLGNESFVALVNTPPSEENKILDSDKHKDDLAKNKAETDKNSRFLKGLYESLVLGDISNDEYRELKSTYESKMAFLTEQEAILRKTILNSLRNEKAMEEARDSAVSLKSVSDLSAELIARTVDRMTVYERERIEVVMLFGAEKICNEGSACHE
jgi:predicted Zn-dependent protease